MGPLIPQGIIDPSWNHVLAFLIGIGFGFILEASGFSTSRKIVGVFYGYDFVVLRVFMTAAATAMVGLIYFSYMGWIDKEMIFILPTYLTSIIVGGVIMGLGFLIGGFCPGTSLCGVAIGKIDAIFFTIGMYLGILLFSELYPLFDGIYNGQSLGPILIHEIIGISSKWFALIFVVMTLAAFFVASLIKSGNKQIENLNQGHE
jgi:hypothetical protein